jgi:hypothetical protein
MNQFHFSPYDQLDCPDPSAAAFDIGRRLQRLGFHIQQAWLLADGGGVTPPQLLVLKVRTASQLRWIASQRQFDLADRVLKRLASAVYLLKVEDPRRLSQLVDSSRETLIDQAFPDRCYEAFEDLREDYRPGYRDDCFRDFVARLIEPSFERLRHAICDSLVGFDKQTFEAGMVLEEGLSRADIFRFLPPPNANIDELNHHLELGDEAIRKLEAIEGKPLEEFDTYAVGAPVGSFDPESSTGQRIDHKPGEVSPQSNWLEKLHSAWKRAKLLTGDVERTSLANLISLRPSRLVESAEMLYSLTCRTVAKSIGGDRLRVDVENCTVTLDGTTHGVAQQAAYLFAAWLAAPNGQLPFTAVKAMYPDIFGPNDRLDRILGKMPIELKAIVSSGQGHATGIRLPLS